METGSHDEGADRREQPRPAVWLLTMEGCTVPTSITMEALDASIPATGPALIRAKPIAEFLGVCTDAVLAMSKRGDLPAGVVSNKLTLFPRAAVRVALQRLLEGGAA